MSENTFNSQEINLQLQPLPAFIDADGAFKLNTPMLSSFNFDGSIPKADEPVQAINIKPGYLIQIESGGEYFPVVSVEYDEPDIDDTGFVTINYIDDQGVTISAEYEETDEINAVYEDWAEKSLGSQGWGITAGGNAIFTNVGVRGRVEATEGEISGNLIVNGGLLTSETASTTGGIVLNNSGFTSYNTSGVQTFNINADTGQVTIGGAPPVTPDDIPDTSGFIGAGGAATDIVTFNTTITGGNISTGNIKSGGYVGPGTGSAFSTTGMLINLDHGSIASPKFRIDKDGNAFFVGSITGSTITGSTFQTTNDTNLHRIFINGFANQGQITFSSPGELNPGVLVVRPNSEGTELFMSSPRLSATILPSSINLLNKSSGGSEVKITSASIQIVGTLYGNGSGLSNLNAGSISTGTIDLQRIPVPVSRATNANNLNSGVTDGARITGDGVLVTSVSTSTSTDILRRNASNELRATSSSTRKIKTDISKLEEFDVLGIDVVKFKYIDGYLENTDQRVGQLIPGFIAEQVHEEIPVAVDLDSDGDPINWNDRIIIPIIVKTIQDQQKVIEDLQNRVLQLESQLGG